MLYFLLPDRFSDGGESTRPHLRIAAIAKVRNHFSQEVVIVRNTNGEKQRGASITIDSGLHASNSTMKVLYDGSWSDDQLRNPPANQLVTVQKNDGRVTAMIDLPPVGIMILA